MLKAVFLDRDGVINKDIGYLYKQNAFEFIDGAFEACLHFARHGYKIVIITNQSGIGRGYYTQDDFNKLTQWMLDEFVKQGIDILDVAFCPHVPEKNCYCRKPKPGLFLDVCKKFAINPKLSWAIGDKEADIQAAKSANITNTVLVKSGHPVDEKNSKATWVLESLKDCPNVIQ